MTLRSTEDTTTNLVFTFTRSGDLTSALTVSYVVGGTATQGKDYRFLSSTPGRVTFAAGSATATVSVDPLADSTPEPDETVSLRLVLGAGYNLGTNGPVVGTILNDDAPLPPPPPPPPARRYFYGTPRADRLTGSPGPDWLEGRQGADVLTGRQGNDIFSFRFGDSSRNAPDRITDFQRGDRIRLTGFPTRTVLRGSTIREPPSAIFGAAFRDADATRAGLQPLRANQATLLTSNWQGRQTNWLVVNDGSPGRSDRDLLIQITGQLPQQILI
jgi:hypothetical protein